MHFAVVFCVCVGGGEGERIHFIFYRIQSSDFQLVLLFHLDSDNTLNMTAQFSFSRGSMLFPYQFLCQG